MSIQRIAHAYIADTARVRGQVTLGQNVNIWYGAAIRGDVAPVIIGDNTNVQDNAVIHCEHGHTNHIGSNVTIGHSAIVHCEEVGDGTLIGMHATVLDRVRIGKNCLVAAGAVVPPGTVVPDGMVVMGVPGRIMRPTNDREKEYLAMIPPRYVELAKRHHEHPDDEITRPWTGPV